MSVVIVGGNECMVRQYKDLCSEYNCKAKVYPKALNGLRSMFQMYIDGVSLRGIAENMNQAGIRSVLGNGGPADQLRRTV